MRKVVSPQFASLECRLNYIAGYGTCILGVAALLLATGSSALAQTTNVTDVYTPLAETSAANVNNMTLTSYATDKARLTVAVNEISSAATSVRVNLARGERTLTSSVTNFVDPNYFITNYYNLKPAVATLAVTGVPATGGGAAVVLGAQTITNASGGNLNVDVAVTLNYTNLASGDYDMAVHATGANAWRYPLPVKAGYKWSAGGGAANIAFSAPLNWVGGVVPGLNDIVILDNAGSVTGATNPTVSIAANTAIGSLSDIHTGDNYTHLGIAAGATLSIVGDGGFRQLVDRIDVSERSRIRASGAGTLIVSNASAEFNLITSRQNTSYDNADFSALNTLIVDVKKIAFNDQAAYPNIGTNGILNRPYRNVYDMDWALTNILRATHTDTQGWTNDAREYGMVINREFVSGQTGNDGGMHFGLYNELYFDSILFGGYSQMESPEVDFRADGSYLKLRNVDKVSRVSNVTIADAVDYFSTGNSAGGGTKVDVSFTRGTVDALIDTLIIGREPRITANGPATGRLYLGPGLYDINKVFVGYQTGPGLGTESGAAIGQIQLNNGTVLRVNDTLVLGYTVTNSPAVIYGTGGGGTLTINAGGLAAINNLSVGGPANASVGNTISITGGGQLAVTNTAGSLEAPINRLTMNDSTLVLYGDPGVTNVFVQTLVTGGAGNTIKIVSLANVSAYPARLSLISYQGDAAPNFGLELPAGIYGYVENNTAKKTIDAVITTTPPQQLIWAGTINGNWDSSTANWQGGKLFTDGDSVTFDDTASGTTSVTIPSPVTLGSGGVLVTNNTKPYSLSGSSMGGSATMVKDGTSSLAIDAPSSLALIINNGTVTGSGTIGATTVGAAGKLNYSGSISKLTTSGSTISQGTVNLGVDVKGGAFTNSGTINGAFVTSGSSETVNTASSRVNATGTSTVGTGSKLVQEGWFRNTTARLGIAGHLTGSGTVTDATGDAAGNNGRLEINPGGRFTPGGENVIGTFIVEGRFDLNEGTPDGVLEIDIDLNHPQKNDLLAVDKFSNFRGSFKFNNIGSIPFAAGQSFLIFSNNFSAVNANSPEASNNYLNKTVPRTPGIGLQWDFTNLKTNGVVAIIAAPSTPPMMTNIVSGTNLTLSWPASHLGYQLQAQTNSLDVGLTTTWYPVPGTELVTSTNIAIQAGSPAVFYRLSNQ